MYPPRDMAFLTEARIREAFMRGELDSLPGCGKPLPPDDLAGLPAEDRIAARIQRSLGAAPEEVALLRETSELREVIAKEPDDGKRKALVRRLEERMLRLRVLLESSGRGAMLQATLEQPR